MPTNPQLTVEECAREIIDYFCANPDNTIHWGVRDEIPTSTIGTVANGIRGTKRR